MTASKGPPHIWSRLFAGAVLAMSMTSAVAADARPGIPTTAIPAVRCAYTILRYDKGVRAVEVYAIDGFRSAIEYRFEDKRGKTVVGDLMLRVLQGETWYDVGTPYAESRDAGFESLDFLSTRAIASRCHLKAAFDNLYPRPKPRAEWQPVDVSSILISAP